MALRRIIYASVVFILPIIGLSLFPFLVISGNRGYQEVIIPAEGYEIKGYLSQGKNADGPWIVFGHGNRKEGQAGELYQYILKNLKTEATVLAIDFRGFGGSSAEGLAESEEIIIRMGDIEAAVAYLKNNLNAREDRIIVMGHSMGAAQAMVIAQVHSFALAIPIGLGDWDFVLSDSDEMKFFIEKFYANTGVRLGQEDLRREAIYLTPQSFFSKCPETPIVLIFGSQEESRQTLASYYQAAHDRCGEGVTIVTIYLSGHMYGTESYELPTPVRKFISRIQVSYLVYVLNNLISTYS
jgi:pimeloyl-ACP methyl ester carboxylesterase